MTGNEMIKWARKQLAQWQAARVEPMARGQIVDMFMDETQWPLATANAITDAIIGD